MITILLPCSPGRAPFLAQALGSVFRQRGADWSLMAWLDGEDADCLDLLQQAKREAPDRVHVGARLRRSGEAITRNALLSWWSIAAASEDLACWMDDDDLMHRDRLAKQEAFMAQRPEVAISFSTMSMFASPEAEAFAICSLPLPTERGMYPELLGADLKAYVGNINHSTAIFRKAVAAVSYRPEVRTGGTDLLWLYEVVNLGFRVGYLPETLYYLRQHPGRLTKRRNALPAAEIAADLARFQAAAALIKERSCVAAHAG